MITFVKENGIFIVSTFLLITLVVSASQLQKIHESAEAPQPAAETAVSAQKGVTISAPTITTTSSNSTSGQPRSAPIQTPTVSPTPAPKPAVTPIRQREYNELREDD